MEFLGQVYKLKETLTEIKTELTPSFDEILRRYLGQFVRTKFKDPLYTIEATYPTEPLKTFIRRIIKGLQTPTVQGTYLIRGFGFGKTHALILLWHLLNSKEAAKSNLAEELGINSELTRETITIGADFSKEKPLSMIFDELEALAKRRPEWSIKDSRLSQVAIEVRDINELKRYGVSPEEIQIDLLATIKPEEVSKALARIEETIEYLKVQSARIEEKEYNGQKFYLPSLMRTIFDKLAAFVSEQRRILRDETQIPAYLQSTGIPSLFYNPKAFIPSREREVTILLKEYNKLINIDELLNSEDVRESQRTGKATLIVVPPWDAFLFHELHERKTDYHTLLNTISQKLKGANAEGKIPRPFHLSILIPNISPERLVRLKEDVVSYMAIKEFLKHLKDKEKIIEDRLYDYEKTIQKRLTLRLAEYFEQQRKKLEASLRHSLERQILDASSSAQRELIKLTRRIAASVLELYDEVIYCSLQTRDFTSKSLIQLFSELEPRIERERAESIQDYSLIINMVLWQNYWFNRAHMEPRYLS